jgi:hypothetical protein
MNIHKKKERRENKGRIGNGNLAEGITGLGLSSARLDPEIAIPARGDVFVSGNGYGVLLD